MKSLFIVLILFTYCCVNSFKPANDKNCFSTIFIKYEKKFDTLIVYTNSGLQKKYMYKILGFKKGKWYLIEYYNNEYFKKKDSVINRNCNFCEGTFSSILKNNILVIPNESELSYNCRHVRDTIINGVMVTEITDLEAIADKEIHIIEYKIGKVKRRISYSSPAEALKICPESKERADVLNIISLLQKVN